MNVGQAVPSQQHSPSPGTPADKTGVARPARARTPARGPRETVERLFAAFAAGNLDQLLETVHPESRWRYTGANPELSQEEFTGRAAVRRFFERMLQRLDLATFTPREFVVQGDIVVVFGGESGLVRASRRLFSNEWVRRFVVREGLITAMEEVNLQLPSKAGEVPRGFYRSSPGLPILPR